MHCLVCGEEMRLVEALPAEAMVGFEHHVFQCVGCNDMEKRLVFIRPGETAPRPVADLQLHEDAADATLQPGADSTAETHDAPSVAGGEMHPVAPPVVPAPEAVSSSPVIQSPAIQSIAIPDAPKEPREAWERSVAKHRERWTDLCARIGLRIVTDTFFRGK